MPSFSYRALGRDGKEVRGVLQAESETAAVTRIRDNYPVLLSISEQADKKNASSILQMEIGAKGTIRPLFPVCHYTPFRHVHSEGYENVGRTVYRQKT